MGSAIVVEIQRAPVRVLDVTVAEVEGEPGLRITLLEGDPPAQIPTLDKVAELYVPPNAPLSRARVAKLGAHWRGLVEAYGLPDLPEGWNEESPDLTREAEYQIPLYELSFYSGMARRIIASQASARGDHAPLRKLLPGHRSNEIETVRLQMTSGDLLRTLGAFRPFVDWRTGMWAFALGGWWPLLVFNTLVRAPRHTDVIRCAARDCHRPVPPQRRRAGRYVRGKVGEHYCSDQCMWREQKRRRRPQRVARGH